MDEATRLKMLKLDLGIVSSGLYDERLTQMLKFAEAEIHKEGVSQLDTEKLEDSQLVIMYAAWLWRNRESGAGMPRMLRYALNIRVFSEKMGGVNNG